MRFIDEEDAGRLTFFSLVGMTGSSVQNVSSMSMGWGGVSCWGVSCCNVSLRSALGCLLALFLGFGGLAMSLTSTGTYLVPR